MRNFLAVIIFLLSACRLNTKPDKKTADCRLPFDTQHSTLLFKNKCAACHDVAKLLYGPALKPFTESPGQLAKAYNADRKTHVAIHVTECELREIEFYIDNNKEYIDR